MRALGHIVVAYPFQDRTTAVVSLSEQGRRFARDRLGRSLENSGRDDGRSTAQVLRVSELYVRLVSLGASDWLGCRANTDRFEWYDGDEVPDLAAVAPTLDAALDTGSHRYLIDAEPIIASERGFASKIERYRRTMASNRTDTLVLLTDKAGVRFVRDWLAANGNAQGPPVFAGDLDQTVALLSSAIGLGPAVPATPPFGSSIVTELRTFLTHIIKRSGLSSTRWPPNWRTVMSAVYGEAEWTTLGPKLEERAANAAARLQTKPGDNT
ncbi:MAG: hypothetical protein IT381_26065 [Deltaproteobacteria bacterium]|nr:hypothetical protein [Deltaproteobacteria bacterium]